MVKNLIRKSLLEQGQLLSKNFIHKANIDIQNAAIKHLDIKSSKNINSSISVDPVLFYESPWVQLQPRQ